MASETSELAVVNVYLHPGEVFVCEHCKGQFVLDEGESIVHRTMTQKPFPSTPPTPEQRAKRELPPVEWEIREYTLICEPCWAKVPQA